MERGAAIINSSKRAVLLLESLLVGIYVRSMARVFPSLAVRQGFLLGERDASGSGDSVESPGQCAYEPTVTSLVQAIRRGRRLIGRGTCFTEALMLQHMLSRRRIPSRIIFGGKQESNSKFLAHAWVEIDGVPVFGFNPKEIFNRFES